MYKCNVSLSFSLLLVRRANWKGSNDVTSLSDGHRKFISRPPLFEIDCWFTIHFCLSLSLSLSQQSRPLQLTAVLAYQFGHCTLLQEQEMERKTQSIPSKLLLFTIERKRCKKKSFLNASFFLWKKKCGSLSQINGALFYKSASLKKQKKKAFKNLFSNDVDDVFYYFSIHTVEERGRCVCETGQHPEINCLEWKRSREHDNSNACAPYHYSLYSTFA